MRIIMREIMDYEEEYYREVENIREYDDNYD